eukprot:GAFH01003252.1.p4 GENE.GAFH01003252.1~~GAFH01003252.1.p4  ORF type:complete len:67 (-),score=7.30 GAFH01003252.1:352-552(-)
MWMSLREDRDPFGRATPFEVVLEEMAPLVGESAKEGQFRAEQLHLSVTLHTPAHANQDVDLVDKSL